MHLHSPLDPPPSPPHAADTYCDGRAAAMSDRVSGYKIQLFVALLLLTKAEEEKNIINLDQGRTGLFDTESNKAAAQKGGDERVQSQQWRHVASTSTQEPPSHRLSSNNNIVAHFFAFRQSSKLIGISVGENNNSV